MTKYPMTKEARNPNDKALNHQSRHPFELIRHYGFVIGYFVIA